MLVLRKLGGVADEVAQLKLEALVVLELVQQRAAWPALTLTPVVAPKALPAPARVGLVPAAHHAAVRGRAEAWIATHGRGHCHRSCAASQRLDLHEASVVRRIKGGVKALHRRIRGA